MYVNTVSHYNYYFNANEKVKEAAQNAQLAHQDEFSEVIRLFPFSEEGVLKGNIPQMDEAIKKCNHIITRRHSSRWVDDSWLLIGKADFFKGDFFAALEAFEYVATTYKKSQIRYEAEIWIIKSLIMLEKYDEAVAVSDLMIADKNFPKKFKKELYLVSAEGLVRQGKYQIAYERLKIAMPELKAKDFRYRRNFVAGQLAMLNNKPEEAIKYFSKVVKANSPYEFNFYSRINMVRLYTQEPINNTAKGKRILTKMLKDDKNLDLLDQIYYELGMIELNNNDRLSALINFKNALSHSTNKNLQSHVYLLVAELYFENSHYVFAQKYYDSAVQVLDHQSPDFEAISSKHIVLTDLITNLVNISYQDSVLRLARDPEFRKETLKRIKEEEQKRLEEEEYQKNNPFNNQNDPFAGTPGQINQQQNMQQTDSRFPFYNVQLKTKGEGDFIRIWGNRELGDFWRVQSIAKVENSKIDEDLDDVAIEEDDNSVTKPSQTPKDLGEDDFKYFSSVPFDIAAQENAENSMGESYFKAGSIYREKLSEPIKAKELLEVFLKKFEENSFRENILYLLIKIYDAEGNQARVEQLKSILSNDYPDSKFIQLLENPEQIKGTVLSQEDFVSEQYEVFYNKFKSKDFKAAISIYDSIKSSSQGNELEGQFDFIYALIKAEQKEMEEYYKIMMDIAANYSGTPLGDLANERVLAYERMHGITSYDQTSNIDQSQTIQNSKYSKGKEEEEYHFIMKIMPNMDLNMTKIAFSDFNRDFRSDMGLQITNSFVGRENSILIVSGFYNQSDVKKYIDDIVVNNAFISKLKTTSDKKNFLFISKGNFTTLLKEKKWDEYQEYFLKTYL